MPGRDLHKLPSTRHGHRRTALPASDGVHIFVPARLAVKLVRLLTQNHPDLERVKSGSSLKKTRSNLRISPDILSVPGARKRIADETRKQKTSRRSLWGRTQHMPDGMANKWMRGIEQKTVSREMLEEQSPDLKAAELEALLSAARDG